MHDILETRAIKLGEFITKEKATVRKAAKCFGVSKSTVHKDVTQRLKSINSSLYNEVQKILQINKSQRHIRGGYATKTKYEKNRNSKYKSTFECLKT